MNEREQLIKLVKDHPEIADKVIALAKEIIAKRETNTNK